MFKEQLTKYVYKIKSRKSPAHEMGCYVGCIEYMINSVHENEGRWSKPHNGQRFS